MTCSLMYARCCCSGIAGCNCVEIQLAKARAEGVKDANLAKMRPGCALSCHRFRLKGAWAMRVNRAGKVVEKMKSKGESLTPRLSLCT